MFSSDLSLSIDAILSRLTLYTEWLKLWTPKFAVRSAQNIQEVYDTEKNLVEIIKYGTKIFKKPDINKHSKVERYHQIYAADLNTILTAMKGKRLFERFGFNLIKSKKKIHSPPNLVYDFKEWEFNRKQADWKNTKSTEVLSGYKLPPKLQAMLSLCIDKKLK